MGFFSYLTADTAVSIPNRYSERQTFTVYLLSPDGEHIREDDYDGCGVFGGKDVFVLWMRHNHPELCDPEPQHEFRNRDTFFKQFSRTTDVGIANCEYPIKLATAPVDYHSVGASAHCPHQGYFYGNLLAKIFG